MEKDKIEQAIENFETVQKQIKKMNNKFMSTDNVDMALSVLKAHKKAGDELPEKLYPANHRYYPDRLGYNNAIDQAIPILAQKNTEIHEYKLAAEAEARKVDEYAKEIAELKHDKEALSDALEQAVHEINELKRKIREFVETDKATGKCTDLLLSSGISKEAKHIMQKYEQAKTVLYKIAKLEE